MPDLVAGSISCGVVQVWPKPGSALKSAQASIAKDKRERIIMSLIPMRLTRLLDAEQLLNRCKVASRIGQRSSATIFDNVVALPVCGIRDKFSTFQRFAGRCLRAPVYRTAAIAL